MTSKDSFGSRSGLDVGGTTYEVFRIAGVEGLEAASRLPYSLKILLENLLRTEDGANITAEHIARCAPGTRRPQPDTEIQFTPARVVMQDFTGVPCVVDLATMREAMRDLGGDPARSTRWHPAELVIDHSVMPTSSARRTPSQRNVEIEYERNGERYQFLRWGQTAFDDFKVVPPGTGIVHQVNLEYLARVVMTRDATACCALSRHLVGTDSHTTMVNGLGVLGWGVGGIEAEAAMLGQPVSMLIPQRRRLQAHRRAARGRDGDRPGADHHRAAAQARRRRQVRGVLRRRASAAVPLANRATIGNMSPEFGSTVRDLPDRRRDPALPAAHRSRRRAGRAGRGVRQGAGPVARPGASSRVFTEYVELDLSTVVPSHRRARAPAGPGRRCPRPKAQFQHDLPLKAHVGRRRCRRGRRGVLPGERLAGDQRRPAARHATYARGHEDGTEFELDHGAVVDRLHHQLHQHVQPVGHGRRRRCSPRRPSSAGLTTQAVGQDHASRPARRSSRTTTTQAGLTPYLEQARLQPRRLRLHDLHRQLRPAARDGQRGDQRQRPGGRRGALAATATSRAASTRTSR